MKTSTLLLIIFLVINLSFAQTKITVSPNLYYKDTLKVKLLIESLNGFLSQKDIENDKNMYVLNSDLLETSILLDEMKGIELNRKYKDNNFYKPYLNNIRAIDSLNYIIQFSYLGIKDTIPELMATFEMIARLKNNQYYFNSPLLRNTSHWKIEKIGNISFHFKGKLNKTKANEYQNKLQEFDKKLNIKNKNIEWYGCKDITELLQNIGVKYCANYNGRSYISGFSTFQNNTFLLVDGDDNEEFNQFDPHDLWHSRARIVIPSEKYHKPTDCAYAHIVGGSWGMSWETIWKMFKERVANNKSKNWLEEYEKNPNFGDSPQKHLRPVYILNALLLKMIEKKYGFEKALEFMSIGPYEKTNDNYFKALEKITGITKANYNEKLWELINAEH